MKNRILRVLLLLLLAAATSHAQVLTQAEYFVDADPGVGLATPLTVSPGDTVIKDFSFSISGISPGYHFFSIRTRDAAGRWGIVMSSRFYIHEIQNQPMIHPRYFPITKAEYFYDTDPGKGMGISLPVIRGDTVDVYRYLRIIGLDTGYHYLYIRAMAENNLWGLAQRARIHVDTSICTMPVANFSFDTVTFGTLCHFTNVSTDTSDRVQYKWDINNDGSIEDTTRNLNYTFTAPGYYQVKLTVENDSSCSSGIIKDVMTGPKPNTNLLIAGSISLCKGDSVILTSNNYEEGCRFDWSTGDTSRAITVKSTGNYFCWATNSYGISLRSEIVHVQVYDVPLVTLTYHNTTGGSANGSAWVVVNGGTGQYIYQWSNGATTPILNGLSIGTYTVTVSDSHCPVIKDFTIVNEQVTAGNISFAEYYFDTDPGPGNGIPIIIWAADSIDFMTTISPDSLVPGFHIVYVRTRDTYGRWGLDRGARFYIGRQPVNPQPVVQPQITRAEYFINTDPGVGKGVDVPVMAGDEVISNFGMPASGLTTGFNHLFVRTRDSIGKWSLYAGLPWYIYDSLKPVLPKKYKSLAGVEYFFDTDPGIGNCNLVTSNIYDTIDLKRDLRISGLAPGLHYIYLRGYDEKGFTGLWQRASFQVDEVACTCPLVDFSADTVHLVGNPTHFVNHSTSLAPDATYEWDVNGDGIIDYTTASVTHTYQQYGLYNARLTVYNNGSCHASMTRQVVVSPMVDTSLTIVGTLTLCAGNSVQISAKPGYSYNWSSDQTTQSITVTQSGDYSVRLTNIYGVQGFSRIVHVTVNPLPVIDLVMINASGGNANGTGICNVSGGTGTYSYLWSTGSTLPIVNNLAAGNYSVTVSDGRCPVIRSFSISNDPIFPGDIVRAEYFFDSDPGVGSGNPMNIAGGDTVTFATLLPAGSLTPGFHDLNVRVCDTYGRWSQIRSERFYIYTQNPLANGTQPPLVKGEYYFDMDPGPGNGISVPVYVGNEVIQDFAAVTSGLQPGFHNLSVRAMDSLGKWSLTEAGKVYIYTVPAVLQQVAQPKIIASEYFYDTDPGIGNGTDIPFSPTGDTVAMNRYFPVNGLVDGSHWVYIRTKDENGKWGLCNRMAFNVLHTVCTTPNPGFTIGTALAGSPVTFTNTSENLTTGTTWQWDINNDGIIEYTTKNIAHTFPVPGNYDVRLKVNNSDTCMASILKQVFVGPLPPTTVTVIGNTTLCNGDSVSLTVAAGYIYQWWPTGQTTRSIYARTSGNYYCWLRTTTGLEVKSQSVVVTSHEVPSVTLHVIDASGGKSNGSAWVEASGGSGKYTYQWSSGSTAMYANNLIPGSYTVQVSDGLCPVVNIFSVGTHPVFPGNIIAAEYFFDTDPGTSLGIPLNVSAADTVEYFTGCNVTGLFPGYHRIFIRVMDTRHSWSMYRQESFYIHDVPVPLTVANQPPITSSEYFVDLDINTKPDPGIGMGKRVAVTPGDNVDVSFGYIVDTMVVGFHHLAVRAEDQDRKWSHIMSANFYIYDTTWRDVTKIQPPIVAAEYFLDMDPGVGNGLPLNITPGDIVSVNGSIPMGGTPLGIHSLYVRVKDSGKKWSLHKSTTFGVYDCTQPTVDFAVVQTCIDTPVTFIDSSTNVDPAATYAWDFNNDGVVDDVTHGSVSHLYTVPGIYQCKLKITHNVACFDSTIKTVVFPFVHLQNDTTIYTDQSIVLDAGPGYSYLWNTGATTQTITVNGATAGIGLHNYSVTVTNGLSCAATDNINVTVTLPPRDLVITMASVFHDTIPDSGDSADMHCVIKNTGTISAVASVVQYYLSSDTVKTAEDQYLGFGIVNALAPGASEAVTSRQFFPAGTSGQVWYILFVADGAGIVVENNEGNNLYPVSFLYSAESIPATLSVIDESIVSGQSKCYNALGTIMVAGGGSFFHVQQGGTATFVAGQVIRFLPDVKVFPGGYLRGYITNNGQYCSSAYNPLVASDTSRIKGSLAGIENDREPPGRKFCYIYPNPTNGEFNLVLSSENRDWPVNVQIYNTYGILIMETTLTEGRSNLFSLREQKPGIYFLHVGHGSSMEVEKVIKY